MTKEKRPNNEEKGNIYDRIFRENAESIFIPLIEMELGIQIKHYQPFQEILSKTIEREIDFLSQLLLLSRLRNFDQSITKIFKEMPITYDIEQDTLYLQGIEKGIEKGEEKKEIQAILGLNEIGIAIPQIAKALNITQKKVKNILKQQGKL